MTNIKRIILTRQQLNEVLKEADMSVTGDNIEQVKQKVNSPEFQNNLTKVQNADNTQTGIVVHPNVPATNNVNGDPPTLDVDSINDIKPSEFNKGFEFRMNAGEQKPGAYESKSFSKKQIEEARLKKIHEGFKMTKRQMQESFDTDEQWKEEIEMFMRGLRMGDYEVFDDVLYVEIFKGQTAENDPRYAYIRKGENRLHDDHFYVQNSPVLSDTQLKDIYYNAGWEDVLPELIDYDGFEMYESKNKIEIKPENKGKFNATKKKTGKSTEELTHSKNPLTRKRAIFAKNAKKWNKK